MRRVHSVVAGTGSHIPDVRVANDAFVHHDFRSPRGERIGKPVAEVVRQFEAITGIRERRYVPDGVVASEIGADAARQALRSAEVDPETLDAILFAHNFGDVHAGARIPDLVPSLAARVKARLGIANPDSAAVDLIFGCPGWLQCVIHADAMIRCGDARRVLVIGADTLSRVSDPHDRDGMIYADGAGAVVLEASESDTPVGVLSHVVRTDAVDHGALLTMGPSYGESPGLSERFLKMEGRKVYKYAVQTVPGAILACLAKAGVPLSGVAKILLHQANGKLDEAVLSALFEEDGSGEPPPGIMPMTIGSLGNSSVATLPTLLDLLCTGRLEGHQVCPGDVVVLASVGAGMHANAVAYRFPA